MVERKGEGFRLPHRNCPLTKGTRLAGGVIRSSLFAATDAANIPDAVANASGGNLLRQHRFPPLLRKEDRFAVVYETLEADGEPLRSGRVLSTEFRNNGKTYEAVWFQEPEASKGAYYTLDG